MHIIWRLDVQIRFQPQFKRSGIPISRPFGAAAASEELKNTGSFKVSGILDV